LKNVLIKFVVCTIAFSGAYRLGIAGEAGRPAVTALPPCFGG